MVTQLLAKPGQRDQNSPTPATTGKNHQRKTQTRKAQAWQASDQLTKGLACSPARVHLASPPRLRREPTSKEPPDLTWHWKVCCVVASPRPDKPTRYQAAWTDTPHHMRRAVTCDGPMVEAFKMPQQPSSATSTKNTPPAPLGGPAPASTLFPCKLG